MLGDDSGASSGAPPSNAPQSGFFGTLSNVATGYKPLCRCAILLVCLRLMSLYTGLHSFEVSAATTTSTATQPLLIADDIDTSTHMRVATSDVLLGESAAVALVTVNVCDLRLVISRAAFLSLCSSRCIPLAVLISHRLYLVIVSISWCSSRYVPLIVFISVSLCLSHIVFISRCAPLAVSLLLCSSHCIPLAVFISRCVYPSLNVLVVCSSR